jgi:predicted RNA-binding Zn-ribbon protein involved in translation (DUF1610 family)
MEFRHMQLRNWVQRYEFKCPACGLDDEWEYDRADAVVTLPAQRLLGGGGTASVQEARMAGRDMQKTMQNAVNALQHASRQAAYQVVKLPCGNCGYVLFLDGSKHLR